MFSNIFLNIKESIIGNCIGINSLYLFIKILYNFKKLLKKKDFKDIQRIENLKKNILNCGCISIKFTQWIISKLKGSDNNQEYTFIIDYFEEIFENCKYHNDTYSIKIIEKLINNKFENVFDKNYFEPIASGSIGQIYKCKYKDTNEFIIIKVRHPYIQKIKSYQMVLIYIIKQMQKIRYFKNKYHLHFNFNDFIENINKQIDFNIESENCIKMYTIYKNNELVIIPKVIDYSNNIIISSYEEGEFIEDVSEYQKCKVAINLLCLVNSMCLIENFMHGDMHCRNWKVRKYKKTYQIILYDFGICFNGPDIAYNKKLWKYGETQQIDKMIDLFLDQTIHTSERDILVVKLNKTFREICEEPFNMNIVFNKLIVIFSQNNLIINNLFLNIILFMCLIEEIFKKVNIIENGVNKIGINNHLKSQKLDIINYCKEYNVYPELLKYQEEDMKKFIEFEKENMNNKELKFKKNLLFNTNSINLDLDTPE
jgi:predicted unusual protein kinase regulating ubiquinone biosynthesis (AarF/ABC1/UbiB family)